MQKSYHPQIVEALENSTQAVSDAQVEAALKVQPPKVEQEIVRIYAQARNRGCNPKQRYSVASRCWRACSPSDSRH